MSTQSRPVRLFIGSSSEGLSIARSLQSELEAHSICEVERWDNVFEPSGYPLDSLLDVAASVDFAVLVASPDDVTVSRGSTESSVRDNILLEFGLFVGALGRKRTYLLTTGEVRLPTDTLGLTWLRLRPRSDDNLRAAVNDAALQIERQVKQLGALGRSTVAPWSAGSQQAALDRELELVCANAAAQGWIVKTNNATTLRLRSPRGKTFTLSKSQPDATRVDLRRFSAQLRAGGLRVNSSIRRPVGDSPF